MRNPKQLGNPRWPSLFGFNLLFINSSSFFSMVQMVRILSFSLCVCVFFFFRIIKLEYTLCYFLALGPLLFLLDVTWLPSKCSHTPAPRVDLIPGREGLRNPVPTSWCQHQIALSPGPRPTANLGSYFCVAFASFSEYLSWKPVWYVSSSKARPSFSLPRKFSLPSLPPPLFLSISPWSLTQTPPGLGCTPWLTDVPILTVVGGGVSGLLITSHHVPSYQSVTASLGAPMLMTFMDYKSMLLSPWQQALACPSDFFSALQYGPSTLPSLPFLFLTPALSHVGRLYFQPLPIIPSFL